MNAKTFLTKASPFASTESAAGKRFSFTGTPTVMPIAYTVPYHSYTFKPDQQHLATPSPANARLYQTTHCVGCRCHGSGQITCRTSLIIVVVQTKSIFLNLVPKKDQMKVSLD